MRVPAPSGKPHVLDVPLLGDDARQLALEVDDVRAGAREHVVERRLLRGRGRQHQGDADQRDRDPSSPEP